MDKAGNIVKAIVAAPDLKPIRDVEHGCEHLREFMNGGTKAAEQFTISYTNLQATLANLEEVQKTKGTKETPKESVSHLKATYLCLQCSDVSSLEDREVHSQAKRHRFSTSPVFRFLENANSFVAVESRTGCLYCGLCDDFIYDPGLEKIRVKSNLPTSTGGKKRKLSDITTHGEEDKFVLPNSNLLSCQAGAPRGIYNLGQTCYMSVILQAMVHNPLMRNFFLSSRHESAECTAKDCVACAMVVSFADILATEKIEGHGPLELLYKSWLSNKELMGYKQQDAQEYFLSLINNLHNSVGCQRLNTKNCQCLYHQTFAGKLRSTITCLACKNVTITEDPITDLSLELHQQVKRRKVDGKSANVDAPLELSNCLQNYTSSERLGADGYRCESKICKATQQRARKHVTIKKLPPAMCIQLKRYESNKANPQKLTTKLNFPLQLDMAPYTSRAHRKAHTLAMPKDQSPPTSPITPRSPGWYDLSSVVVHIGQIHSGHYISYCKRDDQWFKYDDSKVTLAKEAQVLNAEAYLLFYIIRSLGAMNEKPATTNSAVERAAASNAANIAKEQRAKKDEEEDDEEEDEE